MGYYSTLTDQKYCLTKIFPYIFHIKPLIFITFSWSHSLADFHEIFTFNSRIIRVYFKGILSTTIVIFSYPKLLSFSILTFIKWRLTPSYAAKDTTFWQKKDPKLSLSELLSRITRIQIYSYDLLCEPVLSMCTV